jgi:hypothetical protein
LVVEAQIALSQKGRQSPVIDGVFQSDHIGDSGIIVAPEIMRGG